MTVDQMIAELRSGRPLLQRERWEIADALKTMSGLLIEGATWIETSPLCDRAVGIPRDMRKAAA